MTVFHLLQIELTYTFMAPSDRWLMKAVWLVSVCESVGMQMHICDDMAWFSPLRGYSWLQPVSRWLWCTLRTCSVFSSRVTVWEPCAGTASTNLLCVCDFDYVCMYSNIPRQTGSRSLLTNFISATMIYVPPFSRLEDKVPLVLMEDVDHKAFASNSVELWSQVSPPAGVCVLVCV